MKHLFFLLTTLFMFETTQAQFEQKPYISVTGEATEFVTPDEILLSISVNERANSLREARRLGAERVNSIVSFLKNSNVKEKHIQTQYQNIGTVLKRNTQNEVDYFQFRQSINICITDINAYDTIVDGLINLGIYNVGSPNFRSTKMEELKEKARNTAIMNAKLKAEKLAQQLNQKIGKALFISDNIGSSNRPVMAYARSESMAMDGGNSIAAGELQVKQTITVYFELL